MAEPTERIAILLELQQQEFEKRAKSAGAAIDRLERKFNPLAAAEERLRRKQDQLNAALEAGKLTTERHAKGMDLVQREYDQTIAKTKKVKDNVVAMNSAVAAQAGFMRRNGHMFQQAGYQVGDFAVQVQGGTSALTAFTQQGSQFLGIFGPWGAIMGAILAVGAPLAGVLWNLGEATEETKEKAKTFADRVSEADAALAAMSATAADVSDLETLRKKYGELTEEVREMALALFEIDKREAVAKVSAIIEEVTGTIAQASEASAGVVAAALAASGTDAAKAEAAAYRAEIEAIQNDIDQRRDAGLFVDQSELNILAQMREELAAMEGDFANIGSLAQEINVSPELLNQISQAQAGLEAARDAGDFSAMADQLGIIRDLLVEAGDTVSQDVVDGVTNAEAVARDMAARLEEGQDAAEGIAAVDLAGGISPAVEEARKLAENFGIALSLAQQLVANAAAANSAGRGRGGDPRKFGGSASDIQTNDLRAQLAYQPGSTAGVPLPKIRTARGGGGRKGRSGGRGREQEPLFNIAAEELQKLQRTMDMLGKSKEEVAALTVKHKLLDEAKKRGLDITDELLQKIDAEAANVGKLAGEYENARDKMAQMEKIQGEWKDSIIDAAMGGADAMDAFTNSLKRAALEYLLFGEGMFAGSGGKKSGGFGGLISGLMGFDGGGYTGNGARSGGVDGKGGYPAIVHPQETIIDHTKGQSIAVSGGGGQMDVRVYVDEDGNWQAKVEQISSGAVSRATPGIVKQSVGSAQKSFTKSKGPWSP